MEEKEAKKKINSRSKGKRGELELAHILQTWGYETRRGQQYSGANGDADVVGLPHIHIEAKRVEHLNLSKAMSQSILDAREGEIPIVVHRKDREQWRVTLDLHDFMRMYKAWEGYQRGIASIGRTKKETEK